MLGSYTGAFPMLEYKYACMKYTPVNDIDAVFEQFRRIIFQSDFITENLQL